MNYRIKAGSTTPITINGKTWKPDTGGDTTYAFDNLEPYTNLAITQIAGTDEDALYLREQSSNADKKPFRYQLTLPNGNYVVRLHFAEIYWGAAGTGLSGGAGSRVMSVKLENQYSLINFDIDQEVGAATAIIKNIPVTVTDGVLNIDFSATVNRPSLSALEVYSFVPSASGGRSAVAINNISLPPAIVSNQNVKIFPNPIHKTFKIEFPEKFKGNTSVQLIDMVGRIYHIGKTQITGSKQVMNIDISTLALNPGMYFLKIDSEGKKAGVFKVIVQ